MMEEADIRLPPPKKLKANHLTMDGTVDDVMDSSVAAHVKPYADLSDSQQDASREQLGKETECGITEFVSPELPGFTGILKKRYTDFLVNEILPSGVVVHLDSLKIPQLGKLVEESSNAKTAPLVSAGTALAPHVSVGEQTSSARNNNDGLQPDDSSQQIYKEPQLFHDKAEIGALDDSHARDHVDKSQPTNQGQRMLELEPASGPRRKETHLIRQTSSGLLRVGEDEEVCIPQQTLGEVTATTRDGRIEDEGSLQSLGQLKAKVVGGVEDPKYGDTRDTYRALAQPGSAADWQAFAEAPEGFQLSTEDREFLVSYFSAEVVDSILALYNRIIHSPHRKPKEYGIVKSVNVIDREARTKIHKAIRRIFNSRLESATDDNGAMAISAAVPRSTWAARTPVDRNHGGRVLQQRGKPGWQELGGDYLHFTLFKENKDTMEVVSYLARQLKMKPQAFQFAGTKDRRGITVQRVSVFRVYAERVIAAGRTLRNAKVGNFEYQPQGLQLGDLTGNEFIVTLRDCNIGEVGTETRAEKASKIVGTAIGNLRARGFINYYGLQRFGTFTTRTDTIGVKMLQGDFKAAVESILEFSPTSLAAAQDSLSGHENISNDDKARAYALNLFKETGKLHPALEELPRKFSAEASILRHLANPERKNDYLGALQTVSRNLRLMYVHAYQSLVWNVAASERWKRHGSKVIEGDLVLDEKYNEKSEAASKPEEIDADGEAIVRPADDDRAGNVEDHFARARALTTEEAESGDYSIFDVVLPTPGFDIIYPANDMLDVYKNFMVSERGGGLDPFDMRRKWKDISLSGSYRKMLARPINDVSYEIKIYEDENEQFVTTDLDRLLKGSPLQQSNNGQAPGASEKKRCGAEKLAVVLKLQLGTSQYATMALRELMKIGGVKTYKPDFGGGR